MNKAILIADFNFKKMEPKIAAVEMMSMPDAECDILPILNTVAKTITSATYISHHKFSVSIMKEAWPRMTEAPTLGLALECLKHCYDVPEEMFSGSPSRWKMGAYSFNNEYETSVRIWNTKRIGSLLIYEVSVVGYKGAIPRPCKKPTSVIRHTI